jgi:hypothetical protein
VTRRYHGIKVSNLLKKTLNIDLLLIILGEVIMGKGNINIFGVKFAYPRGLRKSPGSNWLSSCIGREMEGKHPGSRGAVKRAFIAANKACRAQGRGGTL